MGHVLHQPVAEEEIHRRDAHAAADGAGFVAGLQQHALHIAENALGMAEEGLAGIGGLVAGVVADEQARLQRGLSCHQTPAHGRGIDAQRAAGGAHAAVAGEGEQDRDIVPVEVHGASQKRTSAAATTLARGPKLLMLPSTTLWCALITQR